MDILKNAPQLNHQVLDSTTAEAIARLTQFRQSLYGFFPGRADTLMDLVDALTGNIQARSPVELTLSPLFRRAYGSVYDGIDNFFVPSAPETEAKERRVQEQGLLRLIAGTLSAPKQRPFWLFGIDKTPAPRRFAPTLPDRTYVYQPNTLQGNKPVTIGHDYSVLANLPERTGHTRSAWIVPLIVRRVTSKEVANSIAAEQITTVVTDETLPFHKDLCVQVEDSGYCGITFLGPVAPQPNLVTIVRSPCNRTFYRPPAAAATADKAAGHPTWYGTVFAVSDPQTWGQPDEVAQTTFTTRKGREYTVQLQAWHDLLQRGKRGFPMHKHPFTLMRAQIVDANGHPVYKHDLWLIVIGQRRGELSLSQVWEAYRQRYDLEHFFRCGKQRLLMTAFQTSDTRREENWWQIVQLAYVQLWLTRSLAEAMPRPWERYLPSAPQGSASPATVQRDFERIIRQIGTPAGMPKRRGNAPGRAPGTRLTPRQRHPVVKKQCKRSQGT